MNTAPTDSILLCSNPRCHLDADHPGLCDERLGWELGELAAAEAWDRMASQARGRRLTMLPPPRSLYDTVPVPAYEMAVICDADDSDYVYAATSMGRAS